MTDDTAVTTCRTPPAAGAHRAYAGTRAPLLLSPLLKLPIGAIRPLGWLRAQLEALRDGMAGRLHELSRFLDPRDNAWLSPAGAGVHGWEEVPYWLRGFGDLGYVLGDERIIAEARRWIEGLLGSQREDGYFGPESNRALPDLWPNMPALNALQSYYEHSRDERVPSFMARYFKYQMNLPRERLFPDSWQKARAGDNLESAYWLHSRTDEAWLLDLATLTHERTAAWQRGVPTWHGVNLCQGFREPATYYLQSHDRRHLDASERIYQSVMTLYGQVPGGMFGADENARPGYHGPRQGAETCSMVELMRSFELLLEFSGDVRHADRCEEVAFNSLPAAFSPDYRALRYLTAPNVPLSDAESKAPGLDNGGAMLTFDPHRYRCCQHNHTMGWPHFAEHLWMATRDNGLAATLYADCEVAAEVGAAGRVTIHEAGGYPFREWIDFQIDLERPARFPLYLRVPGWTRGASVEINGRPIAAAPQAEAYVRLERQWSTGDRVRLRLPMTVETRRWRTNADSVSVRRGPLWFALEIDEAWRRIAGSEEWPVYEVLPRSRWNYGLVLDGNSEWRIANGENARLGPGAADGPRAPTPTPSDAEVRRYSGSRARSDGPQPPAPASWARHRADAPGCFQVQIAPGPLPAQPFTQQAAPLRIRAQGRRIDAWQLDHTGLIDELQSSPARSAAPREDITLVPMGCARLRIAAFPVIAETPDAIRWSVPPRPAHPDADRYDPRARGAAAAPASSSDFSAPPLIVWPRRGDVAAVVYELGARRRVCAVGVYWGHDAQNMGNCALPVSWRLLYWAGAPVAGGDAWRGVEGVSAYGVEPDRWHELSFKPVLTEVLRIELQPRAGYAAAMLRWRVDLEAPAGQGV